MLDDNQSPANREDAFVVLEELERNTPDQIRRQRADFCRAVEATVSFQPASASQVTNLKVRDAIGDISLGGCSALFPGSAQVGDLHRLQLDRNALDLPLTRAQSVRCQLIREDAFETDFAFFTPVSVPENVAKHLSSLIS